MAERESYAPGMFCWADLGTSDSDAAKGFYTAVFGWEAIDTPAGDEGGVYTTFKVDGAEVAAMYQIGEAERPAVRPHWSSYVCVEDVDSLSSRVHELGGEILAEPFDVMDAGRMSVLRDPTGALLHLWQPREQRGAGRVNDPGCMVWNELASPDPARARDFFAELLGWTVEPEESGYGVIKLDGAINGGMRPLQDGEPTHWLVYFTVASCDEAIEAVRGAGGALITGPIDTAVGRVAAVSDPQGAPFALYQGDVDP